MDERAYRFGTSLHAVVSFENLSAKIHPADAGSVVPVCRDACDRRPYEIDFRIIAGDDVRWISARGQVRTRRSMAAQCSAFSSTLPAASKLKKAMSCSPEK